MNWALITTIPNTEGRVCVDLKRLKIQHIRFLQRRRAIWHGKVISRFVSAFPRYIFVPVEHAWDVFHQLWRVLGVVAFGDEHELAVVPQREIDRLRKLGGGSDVLPMPAKPEPFKRGVRVRVGGDGPLSGRHAAYQEIATEGRLRLLFDWMGRLIPIEVDQRDVQAEISSRTVKLKRVKRRRRGRYVSAFARPA